MATIECKSAQKGVPSKWVEIADISDLEVAEARKRLDRLLKSAEQVSDAVAQAFVAVANKCPRANPSDLWQHVIYRHLLQKGWSDNRWKRVSGFALERALVLAYGARLGAHGLRMRILGSVEANAVLATIGTTIKATKVDLFLEGKIQADAWTVFGAAHVKSSIAERIQDDVPASTAFMNAGLVSVALTMDAKSFPPPHGDCVNHGELGGRSATVEKERLKRLYVERDGQFDALFSFNSRTPPSPPRTPSGKRIFVLTLTDPQPDEFVSFLVARWNAYAKKSS